MVDDESTAEIRKITVEEIHVLTFLEVHLERNTKRKSLVEL